jgi:outer membrane protein, multidrug efflux system
MYGAFKVFYSGILTLLLIIILCTFSGCATVGPDYNEPELNLSPTWHTEPNMGISYQQMKQELLSSWWTQFNDPLLSSLIERAIAGNLNLKTAQSRVRQARASRSITNADMFPKLNFSGSDSWTRSSDDSFGGSNTSQRLSTSFDSSWELDLFGGVRRSVEAADADLQSSVENLRDVLVSLLAEVALNYIDVRTYQARLTTVNENLQAQNETFQITQWRLKAELSDELAMQQARYNLESTRAEVPSLLTSLDKSMNRIAVLLGEQPGKIHKELESVGIIPIYSMDIAVGVPADLIRRRPDIRKAERDLASKTARIGVATAQLYPQFSLRGSISMDGTSLNQLANNMTTPSDWVLSGGPSVSWPIFDAGVVRQNIKVQSEIQEQSLIQYESSVLNAFEEVENAIISYVNEKRRNANLKEAAQASKLAAKLSQQKYEVGMIDFSVLLDAQRSQLSFESQLAQSNGTVTSNLIRLFKALGGGWTSLASVESPELLTGENNEK